MQQPDEHPVMTPDEIRAAVRAAMSFRDRGSPETEPAFDGDCLRTAPADWCDAERVEIAFEPQLLRSIDGVEHAGMSAPTGLDHVDRPHAMTRGEFIAGWVEARCLAPSPPVTDEGVIIDGKLWRASPCACDYDGCSGWAMAPEYHAAVHDAPHGGNPPTAAPFSDDVAEHVRDLLTNGATGRDHIRDALTDAAEEHSPIVPAPRVKCPRCGDSVDAAMPPCAAVAECNEGRWRR